MPTECPKWNKQNNQNLILNVSFLLCYYFFLKLWCLFSFVYPNKRPTILATLYLLGETEKIVFLSIWKDLLGNHFVGKFSVHHFHSIWPFYHLWHINLFPGKSAISYLKFEFLPCLCQFLFTCLCQFLFTWRAWSITMLLILKTYICITKWLWI